MAGILNAQNNIAASFPTLDQFGPNTTLLLHGDGTNGAQNNTFLDSSANNFTITRNGNTTQGTFSPFSQPNGWWSNKFNGSSDYLATTSTQIIPASSAYTLEAWIYCTNVSSGAIVMAQGTSGAAGRLEIYLSSSGISFQVGSSSFTATCTVPSSQWAHIAVSVTSGGVATAFLNGVNVGTNTSSGYNSPQNTTFKIGVDWTPVYFGGYISNVRVSNTARYSSNFTPQTTPFVSDGNTVFLTCQSNRFVDNSSNAYAISIGGGTPSVQAFKPFSAPTAYYPAVNGGAGYFDGSGDYLTAASNSAFNFGSGDATIEGWVYPTASGQTAGLTDKRSNTGNYSQFPQVSLIGGTLYAYVSYDGSSWAIQITGSALPINAWTHFALVRNGNTWTLYINGAVAGTPVTSSGSVYTGSSALSIGASSDAGGSPLQGYLSNVRLVKGTAVYTSTFTPPTAPLTAITNTSLLLSCTNAGIIDSVSQNQLETVGNAQVSTTQSKFGGASMSFDGNGDYLVTPTSANLGFGSSDFTIEMWFYTNSVINSYPFLATNRSDGAWNANAWQLFDRHTSYNTKITFWIYNNSNSVPTLTSATSISNSNWYHVAVSRSGNTFSLFINGNLESTATYSGAVDAGNQLIAVGGSSAGVTCYNGYIDDLRITKGVARYTQNFTPPQNAFPDYGPLTNIPTVDPNFKNTTLLLHGNGTNGAQNNTFLDSSTNNFTITRNGNTTQGTFTPFSQPNGWWSNYFGGSDYLYAASNAAFSPGTGDFAIQCWAYFNDISTTRPMLQNDGIGTSGTDKFWFAYYSNSLTLGQHSTSNRAYVSWTPAIGQWYHLAVSRVSGTTYMWINGVSQTVTNSTIFNGTSFGQNGVSVGAISTPFYFNGYISNIQYQVGTGFTTLNLPTLPIISPATNAKLLTCQSNRFVDNSANAFALTIVGTPSVQNFYPFFPPLDYSTAAIGGSAYFDGSGDYLTAPDSSAWLLSGDFTIEAWVYPTSFGGGNGRNPIVGQWPGGTATNDAFVAYLTSTGYVALYYGIGGTNASVNGTSQAAKLNSWNHVAITRSGSTVRFYVNGVVDSTTATVSGSFNDSNAVLSVGYFTPGTQSEGSYTGYITDTRIVNGTALYTGSTYTVPTAPLTAITNTSLLLSATNAGIFDNASKNDLETVGNAQISTTQSKFGGSSMYFDGSSAGLSPYKPPIGTADFTFETWIYPTTTSVSDQGVFGIGTDSNGSLQILFNRSGIGAKISVNVYAGTLFASSGTLPLNQWSHLAIVRSNSVCRIFFNGNLDTSSSMSDNISNNNGIAVARAYYNQNYAYFTGYLDDLRLTSGIARYNYNFTPPAAPFPNK